MLKKSLKSRTIYCFTFQKENKSKELSSFLITQEYNHLITLLYIQICLRKKIPSITDSLSQIHSGEIGELEGDVLTCSTTTGMLHLHILLGTYLLP